MKRAFRWPLVMALLVAATACGEFESALTAPTDVSLETTPQEDPPFGVRVFKFGPSHRFFFEASATGGDLYFTTFHLEPGYLNEIVIWRAISREDGWSDITVTELDDPTTQLDSIIVMRRSRGQAAYVIAKYTGTNTATVDADYDNGAYIKFYNSVKPPELEGCTPGYWRQEQHFDSWVGYSPSDEFSSVFGNEAAFPGLTLLDVVWLGGGGDEALGRHAVAALLNASSDVDYPMGEQDVIDAFNDAFGTEDWEDTKDMFEGWNEAGCPLD